MPEKPLAGTPDFAEAEPGSIADLANIIGCEAALTIVTAAHAEVRGELAQLREALAAYWRGETDEVPRG